MRRGLLILLLLGCSSAPALAQNNPVPFVNQPLVPSAVAPGGPDFTLTVNGTGFVNGATVNWNGTALATTFVSSSQLTATVPAAHTALIGTATVTVINPGPGGGASIPALFPVNFAGSVTGRWTSVSAGGTLQVAGSSATGDFNGDGFLDLALPYRQSGVAILQGDGMGGFTLNPSVPSTGSNPLAIAVGDFNGDGKLDLAVTNCSPGSNCNFLGGGGTGPGSVTILLGDGAGNFTVGSSFATGTNPTSVTVGDFNGDGNIDMVVANTDSNDLTILLGDGTGNFTSTQWVSGTVGQGVAVAAGDFNGDGKLDLATTGGILLGDGKGGFTLAPSSVGGGFAIVVADFNGDGKLDIALGSSTSKVTLYLGDGAGGFTAAGTYDTEPPGCAVACYPGVVEALAAIDIDNDGKPELAILSDAFGLFVASVSGTGQLSIQPVPFTSTNQTYPASLAV
ncbi:MAG TPA: VCBS repeat-containing protein, partial [Terriglobia bacterium]|nr:VCBS repeat-containing protein [Terriglobia bacterium]